MSELALFKNSNVPAFLKRVEMSAMAKALAGGADVGKRISIKGGVFRLMSEGKEVAAIEERFLDVVLVAAAPKVNRIWYAKKFDGENPTPPDCWSIDGDTPSADSNNRQAPTCNSCQQNIAGSGKGNSRACSYQQRTAVVLANDMGGSVMQLTVAATSLFGKEEGGNFPLKAYASWLVAQNVDPATVVTRMRFDTSAEFTKLFFKAERYLTEEEYEVVVPQSTSVDALKAITLSIAKTDKAVSVAAPIAGVVPKAKKAAVVEEEDEAPTPAPKAKKAAPVAEKEDEAPAVRKEEKKPSAVPAKKSDLSQLVDAWDDE